MPNMLVAVPVVSVIVERILEFLDLWIVLNLFPKWRSAPAPPPRRLLSKPSKINWDRYSRASAGVKVKKPTFVCIVDTERLELPVNSYREAMSYYENERTLYRDQLQRYVLQWGWFMLDRKLKTRQSRSQPSTGASRPEHASDAYLSALARASRWVRARFAAPRLWLETCLAGQQGILDKDETERFVHDAQSLIAGQAVNGTDPIHGLEQIADYCYFRSRCTYEQFTVRKRQLYVVIGVALGGLIMYLARASLPVLFGTRAGPTPDTGSGVLGSAWTAVARFLQPSMNEMPPQASWLWGAVAGLASQPVHGVTNVVVNLPYGERRGYPSSTEIRNRGYGMP